jgi:hypothetical protein
MVNLALLAELSKKAASDPNTIVFVPRESTVASYRRDRESIAARAGYAKLKLGCDGIAHRFHAIPGINVCAAIFRQPTDGLHRGTAAATRLDTTLVLES